MRRLARAACLALLFFATLPSSSARGAPPAVEAHGSAREQPVQARASGQAQDVAAPDDEEQAGELELGSPYAPYVREHYYRILSRSPTKAFLWELALPGAGHLYTGFPVQAGVAIALSCAGAALWIAGAARELPVLWWVGMGTFTAGRVYGLISAPVTAVLLNAAYRRLFGISGRF